MKDRELKLTLTLTDHYDKMSTWELKELISDALGDGIGWALETFTVTPED